MSADKLILTKSTTLEQVTQYFKDLGPDKQVRARDLGDGRIQLYVRKDSCKQFFTDKLKPDYLIKRDYQNAKKQIHDIAKKIENHGNKGRILFNVQRALELEGHRHDIYTNEFNLRMQDFMNLNKSTKICMDQTQNQSRPGTHQGISIMSEEK